MPGKKALATVVVILTFALCTNADTFTNKTTNESFDGFATQKSARGMTMVYDKKSAKFKQVNLSEYTIAYNASGRRDNVAVIPIDADEIFLSYVVSQELAEAIKTASNKGPRFILLEIDNPGGRGQYAQDLCKVITETTNCPIVSYIKAGNTGGAYSVAVAAALASDRIYIAPNSTMGAVAPKIFASSRYNVKTGYTEDTFSSPKLGAYGTYLESLAEKNKRPRILARAIVDSQMEVLEVKDPDGNISFIDGASKLPGHTVLRTLQKPIKTEPDSSSATLKNVRFTLTAKDAVYTKMADKIASSWKDILADMDASNARMVVSASVDKTVRKFTASKFNLDERLVAAQYFQDKVDEFDAQVKSARSQTVEGIISTNYPENPQVVVKTQEAEMWSKRSRNERIAREQQEAQPQNQFPEGLRTELLTSLRNALNDLMAELDDALVIAYRYPGTLPEDITIQSLEQRYQAAEIYRNDIDRNLRR